MIAMGGVSKSVDQAARRAAFEHFFGITCSQSLLLGLLFEAKGSPLTTDQLAVLQSGNRDSVMQRVCRLRAAMDCEAIDSEQGVGYWLTDQGLAECRRAMSAMAESLRSAA